MRRSSPPAPPSFPSATAASCSCGWWPTAAACGRSRRGRAGPAQSPRAPQRLGRACCSSGPTSGTLLCCASGRPGELPPTPPPRSSRSPKSARSSGRRRTRGRTAAQAPKTWRRSCSRGRARAPKGTGAWCWPWPTGWRTRGPSWPWPPPKACQGARRACSPAAWGRGSTGPWRSRSRSSIPNASCRSPCPTFASRRPSGGSPGPPLTRIPLLTRMAAPPTTGTCSWARQRAPWCWRRATSSGK